MYYNFWGQSEIDKLKFHYISAQMTMTMIITVDNERQNFVVLGWCFDSIKAMSAVGKVKCHALLHSWAHYAKQAAKNSSGRSRMTEPHTVQMVMSE